MTHRSLQWTTHCMHHATCAQAAGKWVNTPVNTAANSCISGARHDAAYLACVAPCAIIFVS
ncbi:hypothetical protein BJG93_36275 [Paraburkholderia sprentiae WSM5005]|uniref:Uncharacterized protein n=1 Tax=Paraburkholderia sprentiae WSM5005 TaxID=754502 RepID=A0A8F4KHN8_9BURK|nr:hypothetical protein BJG93_36275 [Paraburkholderia sprentiae WSM5005]